MTVTTPGAHDWLRSVRGLFLVAMAVFVVTIVIGILNGADVVTFNRDQLLTHVHSGTLGWITLAIVAATAWLARGIDRRLAYALATLIPIYVAAFYSGVLVLRAVTGVILLVAIVWLLAWAWQVYGANRTLPRLAIALGITTFTYSAVIGVLIQVMMAGGPRLLPAGGDLVGAHGGAMVFSYLILITMGLIEWRVRPSAEPSRLGTLQVGLLFVGGLILSGTLLFLTGEAVQAAGGLYLLVQLIAVAIFAVRIVPAAVRTDWTRGAERYFGLAAAFVLLATLIFLYVVFRLIGDPTLTITSPGIYGLALASDHAAFIGVVTNLMFGLLIILTSDRAERWRGADQIVFWAVNIGLVIFLVGLVGDVALLKRIGAPLMGIALLGGLAVLGARLWGSNLRDVEA